MTWIGWTNLGLGLWLAIAAFALPHVRGTGRVEDVVGGLFVALAALWAAEAFRPRISAFASWMVALSGAWVAMAPWVLGYERRSAAVGNDVVVGLLIVTLAAINMRIKDRRIYLAEHASIRRV
jgi:hypothetical protein